ALRVAVAEMAEMVGLGNLPAGMASIVAGLTAHNAKLAAPAAPAPDTSTVALYTMRYDAATESLDLTDTSGNGLAALGTNGTVSATRGPFAGEWSAFFADNAVGYLAHTSHEASLALTGDMSLSMWARTGKNVPLGFLVVFGGDVTSGVQADNLQWALGL